jgi:hypothetical protein
VGGWVERKRGEEMWIEDGLTLLLFIPTQNEPVEST